MVCQIDRVVQRWGASGTERRAIMRAGARSDSVRSSYIIDYMSIMTSFVKDISIDDG